MSTSWYPKCIDPTCTIDDSDYDAGYSDCSNPTVIKDLYKNRLVLKEINEKLENLGWWIELHVADYASGPYWYIMRHVNCKLVLRNEYGEAESIEEPYYTHYNPLDSRNRNRRPSYWLPVGWRGKLVS